MDNIKYAYNLSYQYNVQKVNNNYNFFQKLNNITEDLKIPKRIQLLIKYLDILEPSTRQLVLVKIKQYSYENLKFDPDLQYVISNIDDKFNWNLIISLINNIKYKNFILFIESLYRQSIFIRINNDF
jgi:hypothetical protein